MLRLSCVVHGPIYGSNYPHSGWETVSCSRCFLSRVLMSTGARNCLPPRVSVSNLSHKSTRGPPRRDVTHILSKVSCFFIEILSFSWVTETIGFSPYKSLYFECYATIPMFADAHISSLGYLCFNTSLNISRLRKNASTWISARLFGYLSSSIDIF